MLTWPQALHLGSQTALHDDPLFSIWRLSWVAHALPSDAAHLFDANIFHPHLRTLAYSDAMLFEASLAAPWLWAHVNPVLVYNLLLLGGIVSSGLGMFVLARYLIGDADAALVSAVVFTLVPYRVEHFMHLELQWTVWMPLTLWAVHRAYDEASLRFGAARRRAAVAADALVGLLRRVPRRDRRDARAAARCGRSRGCARAAIAPLGLGAAVAAVLTAAVRDPVHPQHARARSARSRRGRQLQRATRQLSSAPQQNWLWGWTAFEYPGNELHLFPGVAAIALAVARR